MLLDPTRTAAMQAIAERSAPFFPDHEAFLARLATQKREAAETAAVARAHLDAFARRVAQATHALDRGHLGSARAFLEIAQRDFQAALASLPTP